MAFFFQDTVTVPLPLDPTSDIERWFSGNLSYGGARSTDNGSRAASGAAAGAANKTVRLSEPLLTADAGGPVGVDQQQAWMYTSQGILYYAFPIEIASGIVGGLLSLVSLARRRKTSNDSYLIGFTVASVLLLACGGTLKMQDYMPHSNDYQRVYGYIKSANDWLWYTALWILVVMTLERALTVIQNRSRTFCSAAQASVVMAMIFCVCLISALPEFWEYEAIETFDYVSNRTVIVSHVSQTADSPEYRIMYFWYSVTITVFLPYPIMFVMTFVLAQGMRQARQSRRRLLQAKTGVGVGADGGALTRKLSEDVHLTRLHVVLILLYLLLSAPLTFLVIINGITPYWSWPVDNLYNGLYLIFEFVFYFYFSIQLPLYLSYYDKFRQSFLDLFCCGCCCSGNGSRNRKGDRKDVAAAKALRKQPTDEFVYKR